MASELYNELSSIAEMARNAGRLEERTAILTYLHEELIQAQLSQVTNSEVFQLIYRIYRDIESRTYR